MDSNKRRVDPLRWIVLLMMWLEDVTDHANMISYMFGKPKWLMWIDLAVEQVIAKLIQVTLCRKSHDLIDESLQVNYMEGEYCMFCRRCGKHFHGYY